MATELDEPILADDYPVYGNYLYVVNGKPRMCDMMEGTVGEYKRFLHRYDKIANAEVRRCDIAGRRAQMEAK
jgi:hypothetical protein